MKISLIPILYLKDFMVPNHRNNFRYKIDMYISLNCLAHKETPIQSNC